MSDPLSRTAVPVMPHSSESMCHFGHPRPPGSGQDTHDCPQCIARRAKARAELYRLTGIKGLQNYSGTDNNAPQSEYLLHGKSNRHIDPYYE